MSEKKKYEPGRYTIGGKEYCVNALTFDQKVLVFDVMARAGVDDALDMKISEIVKRLNREKLLHRLMAIVLEPVNGEFEEKQIEELIPEIGKIRDDDVLEGIIRDFLHENESSLYKLKNYWGKAQTWLQEKGFLAGISSNSSIAPATAISSKKN